MKKEREKKRKERKGPEKNETKKGNMNEFLFGWEMLELCVVMCFCLRQCLNKSNSPIHQWQWPFHYGVMHLRLPSLHRMTQMDNSLKKTEQEQERP